MSRVGRARGRAAEAPVGAAEGVFPFPATLPVDGNSAKEVMPPKAPVSEPSTSAEEDPLNWGGQHNTDEVRSNPHTI